MKTVAYLRISTGGQDLAAQKLAILDYARSHRFPVARFVEARLSSRCARQREQVLQTVAALQAGDRLVVSELSRLGRSLGQIIQVVDQLLKKGVGLIAIKESIRLEGKQDIQTKVTIALFGLFAEIERDLISERTKEGLAAARANGRLLGRPKGSLGPSKLDGKEGEIQMLLGKRVSKASIAKILDVAPSTLHSFVRSRRLEHKRRPQASSGALQP
jgi:DNA invertase Pin-like site-specific DNA recombinase